MAISHISRGSPWDFRCQERGADPINDIARRHDPFDLFSRFGDLHDRDPFFAQALRAEWVPPVDIRESESGYTFQLEVPRGSADAARKVKIS